MMNALGAKATIAGAILCILGLSLFVYGMSNINYTSTASNTYIVIGIFTGMCGLFILTIDLFGHMR